MTPIVALWPLAATRNLAQCVARRMKPLNLSADTFRSVDVDELDTEALAQKIRELHREMITLGTVSSELHLVVPLPIAHRDAPDAVDRILKAMLAAECTVSAIFVGMQSGLSNVIGIPEDADVRKLQKENIAEISSLVASAPVQASLALFDDYAESGAAVNFNLDLLSRFLSTFFDLLINNFSDLMQPTILAASDKTMAVGMSQYEANLDDIARYLLHKAFVEALDRQGITVEHINAQKAIVEAQRGLENIDSLFSNFYTTHASPLVNNGVPHGEIVAQVDGALDDEMAALKNRLLASLSDDALSLPEKEAVLALELGHDNAKLKGNAFGRDNKVIEHAISGPIDVFVSAFNVFARDSGLLPVKSSYPTLDGRTPDGLPAPDADFAFNPINDIVKIKCDIRDQTAFIRQKEEQVAQLRESLKAQGKSQEVLTDEGIKINGNIRNTGYDIVQQPLDETYTPDPSTVPAQSIDMRNVFSRIKSQGAIGSCCTFSVVSIYESILNRLKGPDDRDADLSERFPFFYSNVLTNRIDEGATFHDVISTIGTHGICLEEFCPYDIDLISVEPSAEAISDATARHITKAQQIPIESSGLRIDNIAKNHKIITSALTEGYPVGIGLKVYENFGSEGRGYISRPSESTINAETGAYHAMTIVGYSETDKFYIVRNSWGEGWGDQGYAYISASYIDDPEFLNFACIITETSQGASKGGVSQTIARFGGTQAEIQIASINNALDEARIRLEYLTEHYKDLFKYYSDLLARLSQPYVRQRLYEIKAEAIERNRWDCESKYDKLTAELPTTLKERCRSYIVAGLCITGFNAIMFFIAWIMGKCGLDVWSSTLTWIILGLITLITAIYWINYAHFRRKTRLELYDQLETYKSRANKYELELRELKLKFHIAGMVIDRFNELEIDLNKCYHRLVGYNNNLRCWRDEDARRVAEGHTPSSHNLFYSLFDPAVLDRLFADKAEVIVDPIDFVRGFNLFDLSEESMRALRSDFEEVTIKAIRSFTGGFSIARYLLGETRYPFLPTTDSTEIMKQLARNAIVLTRHSDHIDAASQAQCLVVQVPQAIQGQWHSMVQRSFAFSPATAQAATGEKITLFSLRLIQRDLLR